MRAKAKTHPGRSPRKSKVRKPDKGKSGKSKKGKPFKG